MNMEELTKSQIVLLTLFVSFVTSIATGIVTVSLMQQAPPAITQTVSRVIQETVQAVQPASASQHAAPTVTQEKTVVLNESDLISAAVAHADSSVVRLYSVGDDPPVFLGIGVVLDAAGTVITDADAVGQDASATIITNSGASVRGFVRKRNNESGIAYIIAATSTGAAPIAWTPITVVADHVVLGETVIALSGKTTPRIASGLIAALLPTGTASTSPQVIDTNLSTDSILDGTPLIDTQGALVGISTSIARASSAAGFMSASVLTQ